MRRRRGGIGTKIIFYQIVEDICPEHGKFQSRRENGIDDLLVPEEDQAHEKNDEGKCDQAVFLPVLCSCEHPIHQVGQDKDEQEDK